MTNQARMGRRLARSLGAKMAYRAVFGTCFGAWTVAGIWFAREQDKDMRELVETAACIAFMGGMVGSRLGWPRITTVGRLTIVGAMIGPFALITKHADIRATIICGAPLGGAVG